MDLTQITGIAAGVFTSFSLLPQLVKILKEKKADDVSPMMLVILMCGLALWVTYGIMRTDWPLIITNSFSLLLNCFLLVARYHYADEK